MDVKAFQMFCYGRFLDIRTGNAEAAVSQHFCQTGHAYTADADKINMVILTRIVCYFSIAIYTSFAIVIAASVFARAAMFVSS